MLFRSIKPGKNRQLAVSTDVIVENVDFIIKELSPEKIGRKALAINLSDMAAMGAKPMAFVITVGKPSSISSAWLERFYRGLLKLAEQYGVSCIGGDFSRSKEFFANITILGEPFNQHAIRRSGALPGDWIGVTGSLGGSRLSHHYDFTPRVQESAYLTKNFFLTSMIDISDGLVQDLQHILKASNVAAKIELDQVHLSRAAMKISKGNRGQALKRALSDGEDFELLFTVPFRQKSLLENRWKQKYPKIPLSWIGKIEKGKPVIHWFLKKKKVSIPKLLQKGYSHF